MVETTKEKPDQLKILCEIPLNVKIGDKEFQVRPLVGTKLVLMRPFLESIVDGAFGNILGKFGNFSSLLEKFSTGEIAESEIATLIFNTMCDSIEKAMECMKIALRIKPKDEDVVTTEFLMDNLEFSTMGVIIGFLVKTANLGETVKNVVILRSVTK